MKIATILSTWFATNPATAVQFTKADLLQSVAALIENKSLQAVLPGMIQSGNSVTAHLFDFVLFSTLNGIVG